jgi:pimeloyl-ACP methyl ester carboxylesterase
MTPVPPSAAPAQYREDLVPLDGGRIRLLVGGEGPPLLYLHGVGDLGAWIPPLAHLARDRAVLRPDHPGFNGSDDLAVATPGDVADVHLRLLDALDVERFTLVGCSFGGWVATELALRAPDRVTQLVLIDPAGMPADEPGPDVLALDPVAAAALTFSGRPMQDAARERAAAMDADLAAREARNRATARRLAGGPVLQDPELPGRVTALGMPVTVVWGEDDRILPVSHARAWAAAVPHARIALVPGAGHLPHVERPTDFFACAGLGAADR